MVGPESDWTVSNKPRLVRAPTEEWEGTRYPLVPSKIGKARAVRQLRDPFVYYEGENSVMFYSFAGESGIAVADWKISEPRGFRRVLGLTKVN